MPSAWGQSFAFPVNGNRRLGAPGLPPRFLFLSVLAAGQKDPVHEVPFAPLFSGVTAALQKGPTS